MGAMSLEEITYQNDNFDWFVRQVTLELPIQRMLRGYKDYSLK
ncbi:unnamed protein product [marine sediment metagenome]|uniref:Uncharacterized protein n=1 Tax=marine sediment metagenome TaxID=412755 RepID=X0TL31_9ZZZZ